MNRVQVKSEEYSGRVCDLVQEDDGSIFIEIKYPGEKVVRKVKINEYLVILQISSE